ncbi:MAG: cell division protein FtsL [Gammaproteobacteria bacterium]
MSELANSRVFCAMLAVLTIATAIFCVYSKHQSRKLFVELQVLTTERDVLEVDWGKLQIEQSTWSTHARVERLARQQMKMRSPKPAEIYLVQP